MMKDTKELWQRPRTEEPTYLSDMDTRFPVTTTKPDGTLALGMGHLRHVYPKIPYRYPKYVLRTRGHGSARKGTTKSRV